VSASRHIDSRALVRLAATIAIVTAIVAIVTAAVWGTGMRRWLGFSFGGVKPTAGAVLSIFANNMKLVVAAALAAAVAQLKVRSAAGHPTRVDANTLGWVSPICELSLLVAALANIAIVGIALGAYGGRMLLALLPHGPFELAAYCVALNFYFTARRRLLSSWAWATALASSSVLLAIAAVLETFAWVG
jgi:Stage II sporulation protein M